MGQVPRTRGVESTRAHKLAYRMPCSCRAEPGQDQEVQEAEDLQRDRGDHRDPGGSEQAGAGLFYHVTPITCCILPLACHGSGQNIHFRCTSCGEPVVSIELIAQASF